MPDATTTTTTTTSTACNPHHLTQQRLVAICPMIKPSRVAEVTAALNHAIDAADLTTKERLCAFLSQVMHETGGFKWMVELGGHGYFAKYDGRRDLGNLHPGDGYTYRGRGWMMLTGRDNYRKAGDALDLDLLSHPDLAATHATSADIAAWYWNTRHVNDAADAYDIRRVTRLVNGGYTALRERLRLYDHCCRTLGGQVCY